MNETDKPRDRATERYHVIEKEYAGCGPIKHIHYRDEKLVDKRARAIKMN